MNGPISIQRQARMVAFCLLTLLGSALSQSATIENPQKGVASWHLLEQQIATELVELHAFLEGWLTGGIDDSDQTFARLPNVMAEGFQIISPDGTHRDRRMILSDIRAAHGSRSAVDKANRIWVENINSRALRGDIFVSTYEEW